MINKIRSSPTYVPQATQTSSPPDLGETNFAKNLEANALDILGRKLAPGMLPKDFEISSFKRILNPNDEKRADTMFRVYVKTGQDVNFVVDYIYNRDTKQPRKVTPEVYLDEVPSDSNNARHSNGYVLGDVIVEFPKGTPEDDVNALANELGATIKPEEDRSDDFYVFQLKGGLEVQTRDQLRNDQRVVSADLNRMNRLLRPGTWEKWVATAEDV